MLFYTVFPTECPYPYRDHIVQRVIIGSMVRYPGGKLSGFEVGADAVQHHLAVDTGLLKWCAAACCADMVKNRARVHPRVYFVSNLDMALLAALYFFIARGQPYRPQISDYSR